VELTKEQIEEYLQALTLFGNTVRSVIPHEKVIETLGKLTELIKENPAMIQDVSKFENWGGVSSLAQSIGNDLTKGGKKVGWTDIMKAFPKIKKQVNALKV
jgi:hypothetical protein